MTIDYATYGGVDVKRFQYEEHATNISDKTINLPKLIGTHLFNNRDIDTNCVMINLEKDIQRYDNTLIEFRKVGINNFSHLKATYWKNHKQLCDDLTFVLDFLKQFNPTINTQNIELDSFLLTNDPNIHIQGGPLGCYVSHLRAMIYGYTNFTDYTIICEDDISVTNASLMEQYISQVPEDWDIIMMNGMSRDKAYDEIFYKFSGGFHSTHFYIIKHTAFPTIFKGLYPITDQVDVLISDISVDNRLNVYNIEQTVYQKNISTNTQNNLYAIYNSPYYDGIRLRLKIVEDGLLILANEILGEHNIAQNSIIAQDLVYDIILRYILLSSDSKKLEKPKEKILSSELFSYLQTFDIDIEEYKNHPTWQKILKELELVLQCSKKGIKQDDITLFLMKKCLVALKKFDTTDKDTKAYSYGSTAQVYLDGIDRVIKKYNSKLLWVTEDHSVPSDIFYKELKILKKIKDTELQPTLIDYDTEDFTITMNYCGDSLWTRFYLPTDWKQQITHIFSVLDREGIYYPEFNPKNILVLDDKITLVDYGLASCSDQPNAENLKRFIEYLEILNNKLADITDRNTVLYLMTIFINNVVDNK